MTIDHFMYAGRDLDALCIRFHALTGIEPEPGGRHPQLGTHNRLVGSDTPLYLELIAPDPSSSVSSLMRYGMEALASPLLYRFVMDGTGRDLDEFEIAYGRAGITVQVHDMHRLTPDGTTVRWRLMVPDPNRFGLYAPFFIDWLDTPHPSTRLQPQIAMARCEVGHPSHVELAALWRQLGVDIELHGSDAPYMRLLLQTRRGNIALTSA
jgi:hypothetical protein